MAVGRGRSTTPFIAAGADHFREASAPCSSALWLTPRLSAAQSLGKEDARLQKKKCGQRLLNSHGWVCVGHLVQRLLNSVLAVG